MNPERGGYNPSEDELKAQSIPEVDKTIAFVDASGQNRDRAFDIAEDQVLKEKEEELANRKWKIGKIWTNIKFTTFHETKRRNRMLDAEKKQQETGNWYAEEGQTDAMQKELESVVDRFANEAGEESRIGEKNQNLEEYFGKEKSDTAKDIKLSVNKLIKEYAQGKITSKEAFDQERVRSLNLIKGIPDEVKGQMLGYADNMFKVAEQVRNKFEHTKSLDDLDNDFEIVIGTARTGVRTKAELGRFDKAVDWLKSRPGFNLIDEKTLSLGVGVAYLAGARGSQMVARSFATAVGFAAGGAAVGGIYAGMKENKRVKEERAKHARDRAQGKGVPEDEPRRKEMEKYIHKSMSAKESGDHLNSLLEKKGEYSDEEIQSLVNTVAEIDSRIQTSDRHNIDLFRYSDPKTVEQERTGLYILQAKAKLEIKKLAEAGKLKDIIRDKSVDDFLKSSVDARSGGLVEDKARLDRTFNKFKAKKVAKAALKAMAMGAVVGSVAQEARAVFHPGETGVYEGLVEGKKVEYATTPVEALRRWMAGSDTSIDADPSTFAGGGPEPHTLLEQHSGNMNPHEYINQHPGEFKNVHRELWYDNNTPKPVFDKNELKLWWGAENNTGLNQNGDYVFDVSHMKANGSYHDQFNVNAKNAMGEHKIKLLLSMSKDTQAQVVEFEVGPNGEVIIPKGSSAAKLFFDIDSKGHAIFKGKYAEVAETMGTKDGVEQVRILATHVGKDNVEIPYSPPAPALGPDDEPILPPTPDSPWIYPPPIIPIHSRDEMNVKGAPPEKQRDKRNMGESENPYDPYYSGRRKADYIELSEYRLSDAHAEEILQQADEISSFELLTEYKLLSNIDSLPAGKRMSLEKEWERYNRRYSQTEAELDLEYNPYGTSKAKEVISFEDFCKLKQKQLIRRAQNLVLEKAEVGEKPFPKEFYETASLVKGLEQAQEIVVVMDDPIGDATLTIPLFSALEKYFEKNGMNKPIKVLSNSPALFNSLSSQFKNLEVVPYGQTKEYFSKDPKKPRFVFNTHKQFDNYKDLGLSEKDAGDPSKVMSIDWSAWEKEEVPVGNGRLKKYDPIPARIMRNMENMLGQKLFDDINKMESFIDRGPNFDKESDEIKQKYGIKEGEKVIVISAGSSVIPKEYNPQSWRQVILELSKQDPDIHFLFLDDPNPTKQQKYGTVADSLKSRGVNISRATEGLGKMNTILSMADVVLTPDTGLGHYASGLGTPNVMLILGDPVRWSAAKTVRVMHPKAIETYRKQQGTYSPAWGNPDQHFVIDNNEAIGASNIDPSKVVEAVNKALSLEKAVGNTDERKEDKETESAENEYKEILESLKNKGWNLDLEGKHKFKNNAGKYAHTGEEIYNSWPTEQKVMALRSLEQAVDMVMARPDREKYLEGLKTIRPGTYSRWSADGKNIVLPLGDVDRKGDLLPTTRVTEKYVDNVDYLLRNAWQYRTKKPEAEPKSEPENPSEKIISLSKVLEKFPTVKLDNKSYDKIATSVKQEGLRSVVKSIITLTKGLPENVVIRMGDNFSVKSGEVTIDITKPFDKINNQLHTGLRRANPDRAGEVQQKLNARREAREKKEDSTPKTIDFGPEVIPGNLEIKEPEVERGRTKTSKARAKKETTPQESSKENLAETKKELKESLNESAKNLKASIAKWGIRNFRTVKAEADKMIDPDLDVFDTEFSEREDKFPGRTEYGDAKYVIVEQDNETYQMPKGFTRLYVWDRKINELNNLVDKMSEINEPYIRGEMQYLQEYLKANK